MARRRFSLLSSSEVNCLRGAGGRGPLGGAGRMGNDMVVDLVAVLGDDVR